MQEVDPGLGGTSADSEPLLAAASLSSVSLPVVVLSALGTHLVAVSASGLVQVDAALASLTSRIGSLAIGQVNFPSMN